MGRVALVMVETLTALAAAHARGVLHRDIKPSNILLQSDGHTKISDFGIAKSFDMQPGPVAPRDDMTMTGVVLGTPGYLAPERRSGHAATVQSDLYAVGAVMVETMTGQRLGPGSVPAENLTPHLRAVASRALAPDPRHRFASANDMLHAVQIATAGTRQGTRPRPAAHPATMTVQVPVQPSSPVWGTAHLTAPPPLPPRDRRRPTRRRRRLALTAIAVLTVAAALFVLLETGAGPTGPAASTATHHRERTQGHALTGTDPTPTTDAESSAITAVATSISSGGFPGDGALASALQATADEPAGADRQASAQQTLALAGVLLDGGGITAGQYQDVVNVLQPTGATVTTTTVTTPTAPAPTPQFPGPFQGHGHDHGQGGGPGDQG